MNVIKRNGESCFFDTSKIVDAVSKAYIRQETKKVEKEIHEVELFSGVGGYNEEIDLNEETDLIIQIYNRILGREFQERIRANFALYLLSSSDVSKHITPTPQTAISSLRSGRSGNRQKHRISYGTGIASPRCIVSIHPGSPYHLTDPCGL